MKIAILTGASSGLGRAYARHIHAVFPEIEEVWALARRADRLETLKKEITDTEMIPVAMDLTSDDGMRALEERLREKRPEVALLINNAGCGFLTPFERSDFSEMERCISLNIASLTRITRLCLNYAAADARILNTSSIASFVPTANMAVYSASKAYVTFFSRALDDELKNSGKSSTAVCPAPMKTEFLTVGHVEGNSKTFERLPYVNVDKVALGALKAAKKRRAVYTPHPFYKFYKFLTRLLPDAVLTKMART